MSAFKRTTHYHPSILTFFILAILFSLFTVTLSQTLIDDTLDLSEEEKLLFGNLTDVGTTSPAIIALFPQSVRYVETPVAVRYALLLSVAYYQTFAACDPVALSFFGTKDRGHPSNVCGKLNRLIAIYQLNYRIILPEYPQEAANFARFGLGIGLNPFNDTTDTNTAVGWANANAISLRKYFDNDGWNALGDETKTFYRFPFQDTTGYLPENNPYTSPRDLPRPLRWQPLPFTDFKGRFAHQIHVTPHIGMKGKPLVLGMEDFESRQAPSPYKFANMSMDIDAEDKETIRERIEKVFEQSRTLDDERVSLAYWWNNKIISLGLFIGYYDALLGLQRTSFGVKAYFGEMLAQHDAILVAWKEKRRHDLVRPTTMIRRLFSGKMVNAYRGFGKGNGMVPADEWEPLLQVQPHSEYPSGSAILCTASLEKLQLELEDTVGPNGTVPAFEFTVTPAFNPMSPVQKDVTFRFETLKEAALSCGESRLYGGVHFEPAVTEGNKLGEGIGRAAYEHVKDLVEGRVPKNCMRCKN